jgi:medium-chain acyl-[acyl-carrier-protein] hydrolase
MGTDGTESHLDWFLTSQARDTPLLRLFCFPHAGGGSHAYVSWPDALPASIEVVAISPPGRGSRIKEPPAQSLDAMAAAICGGLLQLQSESPAPFAFFGHSLGSVVAYEVARRLAKAPGQPSPVLVLASAHQPPAQCRVDPTTWVHQLDDRDFLAQCRARGFIEDGPSGALDSDVMEVLLPALRADLGIHERLAFDEDVGPLLPCPVVAMGGADDDFVSSKSLAGWSAVSACYDGDGEAPTPALFEGGHFYLQTDATFLPYIEAQLLGVIQTLPGSVLVGPMDPRFVQGRCVHELFDEQAERTPDVLAIVDQHVSLTFRELRHQSDLLAAKLQQLGVVRGSIVGSYLPHSVEYIIGNLAIFKAGAAIFPLETNYPADLIEVRAAVGAPPPPTLP